MSQAQRTHQTVTTINVSQEHETPARSSPPPEQAPAAGLSRQETEFVEDSWNANAAAVAGDTEIVEDSMETPAAATIKATRPALRPSQQDQPEHDELYSLTPDGSRVKAAQDTSTTALNAGSELKASDNALDTLLTRGATVHKAAREPVVAEPPAPINEDEEHELQTSLGERSAPSGKASPKSAVKGKRPLRRGQMPLDAEDEEDELQSFDDDPAAPVGSYPPSSKKKSKVTTAQKSTAPVNQPNRAKMASKPAPVNATGSVAALRRLRGQDAPASQSTPRPNSAKAVLQPRNANVQTPAVVPENGTKKTQQDPPPSTAGKLPPVKRGMFAQTPVATTTNQVQKSVTARAKMKVRADIPVDGSYIAIAPASKSTEVTADQRPSLTRPTKAMKETETDEPSTYDVLQSTQDEDEDEYRPNKRNRKGKTAQRKRAAVTSSAAGVPAPVRKAARKSKVNVSKQSPEPEVPSATSRAGPSKSTRARMKAESGTAAPSAPVKTAGMAVQEKSNGLGHPDSAMLDPEFDDLEGAPPIQSAGDGLEEPTVRRNGAPGAKRKQVSIIKKEKLENAQDKLQTETRHCEDDPGASQQNAIVVSDAPSSSEDELSPVRGNTAPSARTPLNRSHASRQNPETPAAGLRSSPPIAAGASTKPTTAGLIDPASARKSTIISFDKTGPRNQGIASAKSARPSMAQADRSSLDPASMGAGSAARLQAQKQALPSSAARGGKAFTRESSATPSNVAAHAQEALAGLKKHSVLQSQHVSKHTANSATNANTALGFSHSAHQDDSFTNIDQHEDDTTLISDIVAPLEEQTIDPLRSSRTLSQMRMPPPMSKAEQKKPVHRAPMVPSMIRPEVQDRRRPSDTVGEGSVLGKRQQIEEQAFTDGTSKRVRREQNTEPETIQHDSLDSLTESPIVRRKAVQRQRQTDIVQQRGASQRQTKRQRSQGTVDIHGSPVPDGMVVGGLNTVLETFSRQVGLSSDKPVREENGARRLDSTSSAFLAVEAAQKQPARLPSNTKAIPAEPSQESQAITHVARLPTNRQPFITAAKTAHAPTDPFTSSEEDRIQGGKDSGTSAFSEHLQQKAARGPATRRAVPIPTHIENDDPDKTLVEEEPEHEPALPKRRPKRIESSSSNSSSNDSAATEDSTPSQHDIGVWRKALKPHAMNLFDEMVIMSHRLVRHLVDKDEAMMHIVDDYSRRGEDLIQSLRVGQAKDMQGYYEKLKGRKRGLQGEMREVGARLAECGTEVKAVRREVRRQVAAKAAAPAVREDVERGMRDVMETFC